jgi:hypothetical protein
MRDNLKHDPDAYREIAEFLLERGEFAMGKLSPLEGWSKPIATAYRPPLYPIVLSNLPTRLGQQVSLAKVAVLHALLGLATVWLTWLTARRNLANRADPAGVQIASFIAGLIVACDPILLHQQTLVMTETLATFLAVLSLWCLARFDRVRTPFNAGMAGGAIGLAILCRPTFLPWLGLAGIWMLVSPERLDFRFQISDFRFGRLGLRLANAAGLMLGASAVVSPWPIRNALVFGKPMITTTHGGYTLYLGNNPSFYDWLERDQSGLPWDARVFQARLWNRWAASPGSFRRNELEFDAFCYRLAKEAINDRPQSFFRACGYRAWQLWSPLPHKLTKEESTGRKLLRFGTCVWYCGVYTLGAVGVWRILKARTEVGTAHATAATPQRAFPTRLWIWGVLLCLAFTAVHTFYWTNLRMRAPLVPFVAMVAAAAANGSKFKVSGSKLLISKP